MLPPVGALETSNAGAAATVVRGAGAFGAAHMLSSVCEPGLEAVAKAAPDALRVFQLCVRGDDAYVEDHVSRAMANGYTAFCLTIDTAHYSRRERDLDNAMSPPGASASAERRSRWRSTGAS